MYAEGQQQHIVDSARREGRVDAADPAADAAICSAEVDAVDEVRKLTDGRGVDVVITAASGAAHEDAPQMAAPSGRISFFGGLPNDKPTIKLDSTTLRRSWTRDVVIRAITGGALVTELSRKTDLAASLADRSHCFVGPIAKPRSHGQAMPGGVSPVRR
jgi:NADPH:quinone reductase-like Zn-dependent oxidoreductase